MGGHGDHRCYIGQQKFRESPRLGTKAKSIQLIVDRHLHPRRQQGRSSRGVRGGKGRGRRGSIWSDGRRVTKRDKLTPPVQLILQLLNILRAELTIVGRSFLRRHALLIGPTSQRVRVYTKLSRSLPNRQQPLCLYLVHSSSSFRVSAGTRSPLRWTREEGSSGDGHMSSLTWIQPSPTEASKSPHMIGVDGGDHPSPFLAAIGAYPTWLTPYCQHSRPKSRLHHGRTAVSGVTTVTSVTPPGSSLGASSNRMRCSYSCILAW